MTIMDIMNDGGLDNRDGAKLSTKQSGRVIYPDICLHAWYPTVGYGQFQNKVLHAVVNAHTTCPTGSSNMTSHFSPSRK